MIGFLLAFAAIVGEFIRLPDTLNDYPKTKFTPNDTTYTVNTPLNSNMVFCVNWQLIFKLFTHPSLHESCFNLYKKLTTKNLYICALHLVIFVFFNLSLQHLRAEHELPHIQNHPIPYMPIFEYNPFHCMRRGRRKRIRPSRVRLLLHDHLGI